MPPSTITLHSSPLIISWSLVSHRSMPNKTITAPSSPVPPILTLPAALDFVAEAALEVDEAVVLTPLAVAVVMVIIDEAADVPDVVAAVADDVLFKIVTWDAESVVVFAVAVTDTELTSMVTVVLGETLFEALALPVCRPLMLK